MFQLKDLPDRHTLRRFIDRYPGADADAVIQFLHILRIGNDLSALLDDFLGGFGLSQGRWWVLILLMREESLTSTPSRLAEQYGVSRPTITKLIDSLERDGWVTRLADAEDQRRSEIRLTRAGQAKLDAVMPEYYRRVKALMSELPATQRRTMLASLKRIREAGAMLSR